MRNAITIANSSDGYPASWVRDTADTPAEATAPGVIPGSEEARVSVDLREAWEKRCSALEERIAEMEYLFGLLLEFSHDMMNDLHAPKARFERTKLLGEWKKHIDRKRLISHHSEE